MRNDHTDEFGVGVLAHFYALKDSNEEDSEFLSLLHMDRLLTDEHCAKVIGSYGERKASKGESGKKDSHEAPEVASLSRSYILVDDKEGIPFVDSDVWDDVKLRNTIEFTAQLRGSIGDDLVDQLRMLQSELSSNIEVLHTLRKRREREFYSLPTDVVQECYSFVSDLSKIVPKTDLKITPIALVKGGTRHITTREEAIIKLLLCNVPTAIAAGAKSIKIIPNRSAAKSQSTLTTSTGKEFFSESHLSSAAGQRLLYNKITKNIEEYIKAIQYMRELLNIEAIEPPNVEEIKNVHTLLANKLKSFQPKRKEEKSIEKAIEKPAVTPLSGPTTEKPKHWLPTSNNPVIPHAVPRAVEQKPEPPKTKGDTPISPHSEIVKSTPAKPKVTAKVSVAAKKDPKKK